MPQPDAEGNEPAEDDKANAMRKIEDIIKANHDIEKFNAEVTSIQSKVKVQVRAPLNTEDGPAFPEVALMRLSNHRETKSDESAVDIQR